MTYHKRFQFTHWYKTLKALVKETQLVFERKFHHFSKISLSRSSLQEKKVNFLLKDNSKKPRGAAHRIQRIFIAYVAIGPIGALTSV